MARVHLCVANFQGAITHCLHLLSSYFDLYCPIEQYLHPSQTDLSAMDPEEKIRIFKTEACNVWASETCSNAYFWSPY